MTGVKDIKNAPLNAKLPLSLVNVEKGFDETKVLNGVTLSLIHI